MDTKKLVVEFGHYANNGNWMRILKQSHFGGEFGNSLEVGTRNEFTSKHFGYAMVSLADKEPGLDWGPLATGMGVIKNGRRLFYVHGTPPKKLSKQFRITQEERAIFTSLVRDFNGPNPAEECIVEGHSRKCPRHKHVFVGSPGPRRIELRTVPSTEPGHTGIEIDVQTHFGKNLCKSNSKFSNTFKDHINKVVIISSAETEMLSRGGVPGKPEFHPYAGDAGFVRLFVYGVAYPPHNVIVDVPDEYVHRVCNSVEVYNKKQNPPVAAPVEEIIVQEPLKALAPIPATLPVATPPPVLTPMRTKYIFDGRLYDMDNLQCLYQDKASNGVDGKLLFTTKYIALGECPLFLCQVKYLPNELKIEGIAPITLEAVTEQFNAGLFNESLAESLMTFHIINQGV